MAITNLAEKLLRPSVLKVFGDELTSTESQRKEEKTSEPSRVTSAQIRIRQKDRIATAATLQESCKQQVKRASDKPFLKGASILWCRHVQQNDQSIYHQLPLYHPSHPSRNESSRKTANSTLIQYM